MSDEDELYEKFDVVEFSLKYPMQNEAPFETAISILAATATSMFIIPLFALMGYLTKVRKSALKGDKPPKFENYRELVSIGSKSFISYVPILVLISFFAILASYIPFFIGFIGIPVIFTPIVGVQFSKSQDYRKVYDGRLLDIITDDLFVRFAGLYIFTLILIIVFGFLLSLISLGIGFLLFIPLFIWYRASFWGYAIRRIQSETKLEKEINSYKNTNNSEDN
jgi:hypothetical protein